MSPDPIHRWGKLNGGQRFHVLAADIDRALSFAMLDSYEVAFMQQVRERCWADPIRAKARGAAWPDPISCRINLRQLGRDTGMPFQRFWKAKAVLIESGILKQDGESLSINKAAHEWIFPRTGKPPTRPGTPSNSATWSGPKIRTNRDNLPNRRPPSGTIRGRNATALHACNATALQDDRGRNATALRGVTPQRYGVKRHSVTGRNATALHPPREEPCARSGRL